MSGPQLMPPTPDRLLLMHDVRALLPQDPAGGCAYSDRWIRDHVAPGASRVVGGRWAVNERAFTAWYARWCANALTADDTPLREKSRRARAAERASTTLRTPGREARHAS